MSDDFDIIKFDIPTNLVINKIPIANSIHVTQSVQTSMRQVRNKLLKDTVDIINPVWYATLNTEQQQELATYRQQLLDVPSQAGFPADITWPTKPTWL